MRLVAIAREEVRVLVRLEVRQAHDDRFGPEGRGDGGDAAGIVSPVTAGGIHSAKQQVVRIVEPRHIDQSFGGTVDLLRHATEAHILQAVGRRGLEAIFAFCGRVQRPSGLKRRFFGRWGSLRMTVREGRELRV